MIIMVTSKCNLQLLTINMMTFMTTVQSMNHDDDKIDKLQDYSQNTLIDDSSKKHVSAVNNNAGLNSEPKLSNARFKIERVFEEPRPFPTRDSMLQLNLAERSTDDRGSGVKFFLGEPTEENLKSDLGGYKSPMPASFGSNYMGLPSLPRPRTLNLLPSRLQKRPSIKQDDDLSLQLIWASGGLRPEANRRERTETIRGSLPDDLTPDDLDELVAANTEFNKFGGSGHWSDSGLNIRKSSKACAENNADTSDTSSGKKGKSRLKRLCVGLQKITMPMDPASRLQKLNSEWDINEKKLEKPIPQVFVHSFQPENERKRSYSENDLNVHANPIFPQSLVEHTRHIARSTGDLIESSIEESFERKWLPKLVKPKPAINQWKASEAAEKRWRSMKKVRFLV